MSYYCEVGLILSQKGFQCLKSEIEKAAEDDDEKRQIFADVQFCGKMFFRKLSCDHTDVFIHWQSVKWRAMQHLYELLKNSVPIEDWQCFIIGEDLSDCQVSGEYYDNEVCAAIRREVVYPIHLLDDSNAEQFLISCGPSDKNP